MPNIKPITIAKFMHELEREFQSLKKKPGVGLPFAHNVLLKEYRKRSGELLCGTMIDLEAFSKLAPSLKMSIMLFLERNLHIEDLRLSTLRSCLQSGARTHGPNPINLADIRIQATNEVLQGIRRAEHSILERLAHWPDLLELELNDFRDQLERMMA